ncbi:MAG: hypothetical protein H6R20_728 [Proteobacteria bacterium]|nr:hypothetical protein [Pseudomonadota bacterium]
MIARAGAALIGVVALTMPWHASAQFVTSPGLQGSQVLDQRSADFALQLRQSQQAVEMQRLNPGDLPARTEMEALHLQQRQRFEDLQSRQRLQTQLRAQPPAGTADLLYQRQRGAIEERGATDQFDRELDAQTRSAERRKAEAERPRLGPTLEP